VVFFAVVSCAIFVFAVFFSTFRVAALLVTLSAVARFTFLVDDGKSKFLGTNRLYHSRPPEAASTSIGEPARRRVRRNQLILRDIVAEGNEGIVKKLAFVVLLFCAVAWAADPNPAEYAINVHVSSSRMVLMTARSLGQDFTQDLDVIIEGKRYELMAFNPNVLLALGDYKAKLVKDEHPNAYDSFQVYEFLFPDKKIRKFTVVGLTE
jgi:hypothetical protein